MSWSNVFQKVIENKEGIKEADAWWVKYERRKDIRRS